MDRVRFEEIWTGELVLIRRNYEVLDEEKPFGWPLIAAFVLRERRLMRDLLIGGLGLAVLALTPMFFWRIMAGDVLEYKTYNTFTVFA